MGPDRYGSDLTDAEWAIVAPRLAKPCERGRHRRWRSREVLDAIFYVLRAGCPWLLPSDSFPPWRTVYRWFGELRDAGGFEGLNDQFVQMDRARVGREPMPSAAVIDSQSVKTAGAGGPCGYDAGKKVKGRKRHAMVDTDGGRSNSSSILPTCRTATAPCPCSSYRAAATRS